MAISGENVFFDVNIRLLHWLFIVYAGAKVLIILRNADFKPINKKKKTG